MADDQASKNLPGEISDRLDGARNALDVTDPLSGFFHGLASNARTKALNRQTIETDAFARNLDAQAGALRTMMELRDAVDDYRARDELADQFYANAKARAQTVLERRAAEGRTAKSDAEWKALEAEHNVEAKVKFKDINFELGEKRKQADIAEVVDVMPAQPAQTQGSAPQQGDPWEKIKLALRDAQQVRVYERATGKDNEPLDEAITRMEEILKAAGVEP